LELVAQCDLFLDQFTIGAEGLAAHEAMALGKPVLCYIKPSVRARYSDDLPIILADQRNLEETLGAWLNDGAGRHEAGRLGRAYVARHHDAKSVAADLVKIYQELMSRARGSALVGASA
jgi:glycosyltransferase involved in cell wall biosynthesis